LGDAVDYSFLEFDAFNEWQATLSS
jgi:hypothetical protein